ncbi:MAG: hypothetical protein J6L86_06385 [Alphaproteobacteria bacterium]|nr:hypothetical protein [Alphaproteobacteria bacterium]MBQ8631116.1 hypothetical protein [Alphaproteobacteria bacterium]
MTMNVLERAKKLHNQAGKSIIAGRNAWTSVVTADFEAFLFQNAGQTYPRPAASKQIFDWENWALRDVSEQKPMYRN